MITKINKTHTINCEYSTSATTTNLTGKRLVPFLSDAAGQRHEYPGCGETLGACLGRGESGAVYEIVNNDSFVIKILNRESQLHSVEKDAVKTYGQRFRFSQGFIKINTHTENNLLIDRDQISYYFMAKGHLIQDGDQYISDSLAYRISKGLRPNNEDLKLFTYKLIYALYFLGYNGFCHGDVKPGNIVFLDDTWSNPAFADWGTLNIARTGAYSTGYEPPDRNKKLNDFDWAIAVDCLNLSKSILKTYEAISIEDVPFTCKDEAKSYTKIFKKIFGFYNLNGPIVPRLKVLLEDDFLKNIANNSAEKTIITNLKSLDFNIIKWQYKEILHWQCKSRTIPIIRLGELSKDEEFDPLCLIAESCALGFIKDINFMEFCYPVAVYDDNGKDIVKLHAPDDLRNMDKDLPWEHRLKDKDAIIDTLAERLKRNIPINADTKNRILEIAKKYKHWNFRVQAEDIWFLDGKAYFNLFTMEADKNHENIFLSSTEALFTNNKNAKEIEMVTGKNISNIDRDVKNFTAFGAAMLDSINSNKPISFDAKFDGHSYHENCKNYLYLIDADKNILKTLDLPDNARILDYGCGTGRFLQEIRKIYPNSFCCGVDIDDYMLEYNRKSMPLNSLFCKPHLLAEEQKFDLIMLLGNGLGIFGDENNAKVQVQNLLKRLTNEGTLLIETGNPIGRGYTKVAIEHIYKGYTDKFYWGGADRIWVENFFKGLNCKVKITTSRNPFFFAKVKKK